MSNITSHFHFVAYPLQGKHATILDKGASALLTVDLATKMQGGAVQVLVNQGYETRHFFKIFMGQLIILFGSHEEYLQNLDKGNKPTVVRLFKVRGTTEDNVHAEQMDPVAASLASDDAFILILPNGRNFAWIGSVCLSVHCRQLFLQLVHVMYRARRNSKRRWPSTA